jgi:hypothetical protein
VTATFVFTDLVDSTATAARLGPEAAEELRQTHFRLLRGAVAASAGTEVKNLGDGLMVMYSSPSRALAGAAGMQQAIEHHNRSTDEPLGVRIGISVGEAVEEDDDYFGDPVDGLRARPCRSARDSLVRRAGSVGAERASGTGADGGDGVGAIGGGEQLDPVAGPLVGASDRRGGRPGSPTGIRSRGLQAGNR